MREVVISANRNPLRALTKGREEAESTEQEIVIPASRNSMHEIADRGNEPDSSEFEVVIPAGRNPQQAFTVIQESEVPASEPAVVILPEGKEEAKTPGRQPEPSTKIQARRPAPQRQRDFLIQYQGRFIGHFHSRRPLTPKVAFGHVARELRIKTAEFVPEQLFLYRPVKLRVKSPASAEASASDGAFSWFEEG